MPGAASGMIAGPSTGSRLKNDLSCRHGGPGGGGGVLTGRVYIPVAAADAGRPRVRKIFFTSRTIFLQWREAGDWLSRSSASADGIVSVCCMLGIDMTRLTVTCPRERRAGGRATSSGIPLHGIDPQKITFSGIAENRGFFQQDQATNLRGKCSKMRKFDAPPGPALTAPRRSPAASAAAASSTCSCRTPSATRPNWPPCPSAPRRRASH